MSMDVCVVEAPTYREVSEDIWDTSRYVLDEKLIDYDGYERFLGNFDKYDGDSYLRPKDFDHFKKYIDEVYDFDRFGKAFDYMKNNDNVYFYFSY